MIKTLTLIIITLICTGKQVEAPTVPPQEYTMVGKYADCGLIFDQSGKRVL